MIFVDESIQHSLGYICVGFAHCEEPPDEAIDLAMVEAGLKPGVDEYKSGYRMIGSSARQLLRDSIYELVRTHCRLGIYIASTQQRTTLLSSVVEAASQLVQVNRLRSPQQLYVDEGILGSYKSTKYVQVTQHCDSRRVRGIQLADFVAYHCSYLLKCELLGRSKTISMSQDDPHPLAGENVELDWILRTDFRRNFFVEPRRIEQMNGDDWFFKLSGYGAFFAPELGKRVEGAAERVFDSMYLGCVW